LARVPPERVVVVGTSCSGKTHLASRLAARMAVPHIEQDALHWEANWTPAEPDPFRLRCEEATSQPSWVADGNYSQVRDIFWTRATTLVWLDYGFLLTFSRALRRTARRIATREELYNGNRETLRGAFEPDGIPRWVIRTWARRRREYPDLFRRPEYAHLEIVRLRRPSEAEAFLASPD
jgi:adenylate kinase family enzyme